MKLTIRVASVLILLGFSHAFIFASEKVENSPPVFTSEPITFIEEFSYYSCDFNATDDELDTLTFFIDTAPGLLIPEYNDINSYRLCGVLGQYEENNVNLVRVGVTDGIDTTYQEYELTIICVNCGPQFTTIPVGNIEIGQEYRYIPQSGPCSDFEERIEAIKLPSWLTYNGWELVGSPSLEDTGVDTVILKLKKQSNICPYETFQRFTISVGDVATNNKPSFKTNYLERFYDCGIRKQLITAEDQDSDSIGFYLISGPDWISVDNQTDTSAYLRANLCCTSQKKDTVDIVLGATDGIDSVKKIFLLPIEIFAPPIFLCQPITSAKVSEEYDFNIRCSMFLCCDQNYVFNSDSLPEWLSFNHETWTLSGIPARKDTGIHNIYLEMNDTMCGNKGAYVYSLYVYENSKPVITSNPPKLVGEDELYSYEVIGEDSDYDDLLYFTDSLPSWLSFNQLTRVLQGVPSGNDLKPTNFIRIGVTDGINTTFQEFNIDISCPNCGPTFAGDGVDTVEVGEYYRYQPISKSCDAADVLYFGETIPDWLTFEDNILSGTAGEKDIGEHDIIIKMVRESAICPYEILQSFQIAVLNSTFIQDNYWDDNVRVFPNPAKEYIVVSTNNNEICNVAMYDLLGNQVLSRKEIEVNQQISLVGVSKGCYVLKIATASNIATVELMVE